MAVADKMKGHFVTGVPSFKLTVKQLPVMLSLDIIVDGSIGMLEKAGFSYASPAPIFHKITLDNLLFNLYVADLANTKSCKKTEK